MTSVFSEVTLQELQGEPFPYYGKSINFAMCARPQYHLGLNIYHLGLNILASHFAFIDTICAVNLSKEEESSSGIGCAFLLNFCADI